MKVLWLAPYKIDYLLKYGLVISRPSGGHSCSWIINWANCLSKIKDVNLDIVTFSSKVPYSQCIKLDNYNVHVIREAIPFTSIGWAAILNLDAILKFRNRIRLFEKKIQEIKPDIIHGHGTEDAYGLCASLSKTPSVISIQGVISDYLKTNPCNRFKHTSKTEIESVINGKNFMCRTHYDKAFVKKYNKDANIFHMPEPINYCFFDVERNEDYPRIINVGGYDERKGLDDFFQAVKVVASRYENLKIDIIGSGSNKRKKFLKELCKNLDIEKYITWHGFLDSIEISRLHKKASIFVITSQNENSPNTLAEALCIGTPSIAYDVGGISSMFEDGKSGFLIPKGNIKMLSEKMLLLLKDKDLRNSFSKESIEFSKSNYPDEVAKCSFIAYKNIINN